MPRWSGCSFSEQTCTLLQAKRRQDLRCRPSWVGYLLQAPLDQARQVHQKPGIHHSTFWQASPLTAQSGFLLRSCQRVCMHRSTGLCSAGMQR